MVVEREGDGSMTNGGGRGEVVPSVEQNGRSHGRELEAINGERQRTSSIWEENTARESSAGMVVMEKKLSPLMGKKRRRPSLMATSGLRKTTAINREGIVGQVRLGTWCAALARRRGRCREAKRLARR